MMVVDVAADGWDHERRTDTVLRGAMGSRGPVEWTARYRTPVLSGGSDGWRKDSKQRAPGGSCVLPPDATSAVL